MTTKFSPHVLTVAACAALTFSVGCGNPKQGNDDGSGVVDNRTQPGSTEDATADATSKSLDYGLTIAASTSWATATTTLRSVDLGATSDSRAATRLWTYEGRTWSVMPNSTGVWLYRLDARTWTPVLKISTYAAAKPSVTVNGNMLHVVMVNGTTAYVAHLDYVAGTANGYRVWPTQTALISVNLGVTAESATLAKDTTGRLWMVSDTGNYIVARHATSPFKTWSTAITVASGVSTSDISEVIALPDKSIGVFWSDLNRKEFGFRVHKDSAVPATWEAPQRPGNGANPTVGNGLADAHFKMALAKDGRLFTVVKTRYNSNTMPLIALLVRGKDGVWSPTVTKIDTRGSRPTIALDETNGLVRVAYPGYQIGGDLYISEAKLSDLVFSDRRVVAAGLLNNPSFLPDTGDGAGTLIAFDGNRLVGFMMKSVLRGPDVTVPFVSGESPAQTTTRLQSAIDAASAAGSGVRLEATKTFDLDGELMVRFPGPRYIDGAFATLRRVAGKGAVLRVESAQDGLVIRDLNILASDGTYSENGAACTATFAHDDAEYGIVLGDMRWATLRSVSVWHASVAGIRVEPLVGENEGTLIDHVVSRYSGDGIQIIGSAASRVQSIRITAPMVHFLRYNGLVVRFADDVQLHGGSVEKVNEDLIKVDDSNRVQLLSYIENFGGYLWNPTGSGSWCPRNPAGNAIEMNRSTHVLSRGRNNEERDRGTVGAAVQASASTCYRVVTRDLVLGQNCLVSAITRPTIRTRFEATMDSVHFGDPVDITPADPMAIVSAKIAEAASKRAGIRLQSGATYNWNPIALNWIKNTPAYIDGRGATITLVPGTAIADAALKFMQPTAYVPIGSDRFSIQDLTINIGGAAKYGILIQGAMGVTIRRVTVNGATMAGFRSEGKPGGGLYYTHLLDDTVNGAPVGVEILTTQDTKYTNANLIENLTTTDVGAVASLAWTAATQFVNTKATYSANYKGDRKLLNTSYSSDIEFYGATLNGSVPTDAAITKAGWCQGIYIDLAK